MNFVEAARDQQEVFKVALTLMLFGGMSVAFGLKKFLTKRKVEDTARSKISSAPQGLVEVEGQAWPTIARKCLDGRPVCFWSIRVQEYRRSGKSSSWHTVYSYATSDEVLVLDESGACLVHPENAQLEITERTIPRNKMSSVQMEFLAAAAPMAARYFNGGTGFWNSFTGGNVRVIEAKLLAGGPVYVRGEFRTSADQTHAVAVGDIASYSGQLKKMNSQAYQRVMFDTNRDGKLSEDELINGYSAAANAFLRIGGVQSVKVSGKITAESEHGLILADIYQGYLVKRAAFISMAGIWGGLALVGAGLFIFFKQIGL
ncbi:MAG: hypothetical protein JSU04_11890 [Bdellovibrionales bacterium]|nr:hypothetical protein [Bdellovibrionales bacterium]